MIRLMSEFRLHGLSLEKSRELILAWNEKNKIGLLQRELEHVLHSAYAHPFPYRYGYHDSILQAFCPYQNIEECEKWHQNRK
ncbi:MAG: hypothetical protein HYS08_01080 [Chlamydiae bacterium]|nr:hypothetical protein [Chlamydiota bacterium]